MTPRPDCVTHPIAGCLVHDHSKEAVVEMRAAMEKIGREFGEAQERQALDAIAGVSPSERRRRDRTIKRIRER